MRFRPDPKSAAPRPSPGGYAADLSPQAGRGESETQLGESCGGSAVGRRLGRRAAARPSGRYWIEKLSTYSVAGFGFNALALPPLPEVMWMPYVVTMDGSTEPLAVAGRSTVNSCHWLLGWICWK